MADQNLMQASYEWANRPSDQRFETLADLWMATRLSAVNSREHDMSMSKACIALDNNQLKLKTSEGRLLSFNNWSFTQFATRVGAQAGYISNLPPQLAADCLNSNMKSSADVTGSMYFDDTTNVIRAFTSQRYGRIFNHDVVKGLMELNDGNGRWIVPPARPSRPGMPGSRIATAEDVAKYRGHPCGGVKEGDSISPAGLYASDRDMFAFMVDSQSNIDDGSDGGLGRGFFVRNSEVGNATFELVVFLYRYICGNHIVWGAKDVKKVNIKHIGRGAKGRAFAQMDEKLKDYAQHSAIDDTNRIKAAKAMELGKDEDDMVDLLWDKKAWMSKKQVQAAWLIAESKVDEDGNPRSAWGMASAVTRLSQQTPYADTRQRLDQVAGKILELV